MNYEISFVFNGMNMNTQCRKDEKIKDICIRALNKSILNVDINDVYLLHSGVMMNIESTLENFLTPIDSKERKINILIYRKNERNNKNEETLSKCIICPICRDSCLIEIVDYKIKLFNCKNDHTTENILIDGFNKTQIINEENIICSKCERSKKEVYGNKFDICLACKNNFCPLCSSSHRKIHTSIINYDEKYFICNTHNESFISFCKDCKDNLCMFCDDAHYYHKKVNLNSILPDMDGIKKKLEYFKSKITKMKGIIQDIIEKMQKLSSFMDKYYKINYDIVNQFDLKKRNYYIFENIKNVEKNLKLSEIDKIIGFNSSLDNIIKNLAIIYKKMTIIKENEDSETESFKAGQKKVYIKENKLYKTNTEFKIQYKIDQNCKKIKLFGKDFVENNSENFVFIYDDDEYKLTEFLEVDKIKTDDKDILEIKLQVIKNNITNLSDMFSECTLLSSLPDICFLDTSNVTNMSGMFRGCKSLNYLSDISKWNTSNVENMNGLFNGCKSLAFLPDISTWDTSNVTDMSWMFYGCKSISKFPDFSEWDVSKVKNFDMMFKGSNINDKIPDKFNVK